jgi:hypothetical protein
MSDTKKVITKRRGLTGIEGSHALVSMVASSPLLFSLLFLFLLVVALPVKIFSPRTKIFR